jgi:hypothetical protein
MDEYEDIETAARHRDWQGCARIMFGELFRCTPDQQRTVAAKALQTYVDIWTEKHSEALQTLPETILADGINRKPPPPPDFPEDLDPADAEFENGLFEFYNAAYFPAAHNQRTVGFAAAIRSAVTARQINRWLRGHPDDYAQWKAGREFGGPTFLDDAAAAEEARTAWMFVDDLLKAQHVPITPFAKQSQSVQQIERLYKQWEESIL